MPIDHEAVHRLAAQFTPHRPPGVAGLIAGVHRDQPLAAWLPMESSPLAPVPVRGNGGWELWALITVVHRNDSDEQLHQVPWGLVQWDHPSGRVAQMIDLRRRSDFDAVLVAARTASPERWAVTNVPAGADDELFQLLDAVLAADEVDLAALVPHYAMLLPPAVLDLYPEIVPAIGGWWGRPSRTTPEPTISAADGTADTDRAPLPALLRRARKITNGLAGEQRDALTADLAAIEARLTDRFRLAVSGPTIAVASTVGVLLAESLLPARRDVGSVTVAYGRDAHVELPGGGSLPVTPGFWDQLPESTAGVRVLLDTEFLRALDGELEIVPGAAPLIGVDALLLAVPTGSPLGQSERELLDHLVRVAHVQRVAVVVTGLEDVDPDERDGVRRYVARRAEQVCPSVRLLTLPTGEGADVEAKRFREAVLELGAPHARGRSRDAQLLGRLTDYADALVAHIEQDARAADQAAAIKAARDRTARHAVEDRRVEWLGIRTEMQARGARTVGGVRQSLLGFRDELLHRLLFELKRSRDPRQWWADDLPFRLGQELERASRSSEARLTATVTADLSWLDTRCTELFGTAVTARRGAQAPIMPAEPNLQSMEASTLSRYRIGFRVAPAVAGLVGALLLPGGIIAMSLAGAAALAAGELKLHDIVAAQHDEVSRALPAAVDRAIDLVSDQMSEKIRNDYAGLLDDIERGERSWIEQEHAAIGREPGPDRADARRAITTEARELLAALHATRSSSSTAGGTR